MLTEDEEMELFGIQNNCIQVEKDLVIKEFVKKTKPIIK